VQDITDRKSFNEKLVLSEARNRGILKSQTNYLVRIDMDKRYSYCNDKFRKDFGWIFPEEKLVGKLARLSVQEYHHERLKNIFRECLEKPNTAFQCEIDKNTKNGEAKTTLWDFVCLTDALGKPVEIQAVGIDITDRVKAQKDLWESNQRYELVSKAASDAIYDWNIEKGTIKWSENYSQLFGYASDVLTHNINEGMERVHPEDRYVLKNLEAVLKGDLENWEAEYRYRKADGEYAYVNGRGAIIRNAQGKAVRMVGAVQDITKRKMALQKLLVSEGRHRGLIQSQTNYVVRTDIHGNYTYCNDKFVEEFSEINSKEDLIGKNAMYSIKKYHYDRVEGVVEQAVQNRGKVFQVELDKAGKNGSTRTTLWDIIFLESANREESEIQCIGIDITDRVEAESQLRFQAAILDKIGQAVIAMDIDGKIRYWNKAATEIYGWKREEAEGKYINTVIPNTRKEEVKEEMFKDLKSGISTSTEYKVEGKNGKNFPVLVIESPFLDERGELKGVVSISSDISDRKRQEIELKNYTRELITANKGLEQFSFIVSHNLRAPLANLLGIAALMHDNDLAPQVKERLMQELLNNIGRLDEVVNDLNSILRVKTEMNENKVKIDLSELV
ncbi:MAG: PAS domain S-box protein, partial [Salinimicrobium sp.]